MLSEPTLPRLSSSAAQHVSPITGRVSVESRTFRKCYADLADGISDPGRLAVQLYSAELIGRDLRREAQKPAIAEQVKTEKLLSAVEDQIATSPATKFKEFLDVLQNEPSLQHLATRLQKTYHEFSGLCTASVLQPTSTPSNHPTYHMPTIGHVQPIQRTSVQCQHDIHFVQPTAPYNLSWECSAIDTYGSYLKSVYTREKLPIYDKWPQLKSKKFINLALIEKEDTTKLEADQFTRATIHGNIDDIKKSKRSMDIDQIAKLPDGSQPKCILVEGAPGVGKSTLAWKLCHKWGKGKLLQQYTLVVFLRLRDKSVQTVKNILGLFQYHDHQIQQAAVERLQRTGGKGVLLLFEGYDELPSDLRTENSVFLDVITGRELPEATVLITSRPWASEFLHRECKRHISQHIEILGFTQPNIQSYLESTTASDPSLLADLKKYISCYPHINSLMYIPLNCAIVVDVYRNSRRDETLVPKTMTELYSSLIRSLLLRHLLNHPLHGKKRRWRVCSFNDLPLDVYQQLCELGKIAYEGILYDQQVIFSNIPEKFETLGLMHCSPELYVDEGAAVSYNFLHLTIQEYLAAFHLSRQPVETQIKHYKKYKAVEKHSYYHFQMVLRFLSGIRKFSEYPNDVVDKLCGVIKMDSDSNVYVNFTMLHWLFEAQDSDVIAKLLGSSNVLLDTQFGYDKNVYVMPFDCFVLGYCVSHSNCTWTIDLGHQYRDSGDCHIGDKGVEMLVQGAVEEVTHCTGGIAEINLSENSITSEGLKHLLAFPKHLINKLETLYLNNIHGTLYVLRDNINRLNSRSCKTLAHLIPHIPHLKKLDLSNNPAIGQGGAVPLITSLTTLDSLEELSLHNTGTGVKDCQALSKLLLSSTSLKKLSISLHLLSETVELICSGLHHNTTLKSLDISDSNISLPSLLSVLRTNHTLIHLDLRACNIDSDEACQLSSVLSKNNVLQKLCLRDNPIGIKGAIALAEMLIKNKSLKVMDIRSIGEKSTQRVIDSLMHNTTLEILYVSSQDLHSTVDKRVRIATDIFSLRQ